MQKERTKTHCLLEQITLDNISGPGSNPPPNTPFHPLVPIEDLSPNHDGTLFMLLTSVGYELPAMLNPRSAC